ncbi:unnamed protein product [Penicillium nalgiovense]|uniref:C2H2-type domain-containing protein n=1 Tax=Penicillium nalgiovense TaxID=60175 RepID=A0A1V6Z5C1_PENNA|nr:hypothetical protein PENNAL_c0003G00931 [Penicillium nalgiovense]CAG7947167.1 unnamed protein product [Penicillium nalgiovense]CAG7958597.1 unnamed protein product [Penicillium nalgiovense]CAG8049253.1 unnamed protein product [Penicillium nalgiovense]CAG8130224.1 unnamed protein product [Penicillium nalgiovense]
MPITEVVLEATALGRAINDASDKTLRAVLKSICAKHDQARKEAESQLLMTATDTDTEESSDNNKRQVPRYAFCINCEKEFDVMTNTEEICRYHPKPSEPTGEDLYVDNYDEFEVDTDEMREDFPECFTFACCDGNLKDNPDGCVSDFHREQYPDAKPSKRSRAF